MHQRRDSRHGPVAQLLIAWSPLSLLLVVYAAAQWVSAPLGVGDGADTNRWGFGLNVAGPADADRWAFGTVPTVWLQRHLVDGAPHWYDAAAALVYVTHFVNIPIVTALVWFRLRDRFAAWVGCVLLFAVIGMSGYVLYPAAPPWLASELGEVGDVARISALGWEQLHLGAVAELTVLGQEGSNPVAAMPSLHAGSAMLVTLFLWPFAGRLWSVVLVGYVLSMGLTLVYTGEHYVVDVIAGWLVAVVAVIAVGVTVRSRGRHPAIWDESRRTSGSGAH
jgi:membrane-associated phospholipid phosphatase